MISREQARSFIQHFDRAKTAEIKARFTPLKSGQVAELRSVLLDRWARDAKLDGPEREARSARYWNSDVGRRDLEDHVVGRVVRDRHEYIPWINSVCPLEGARVLEIGCGSGASVMALAEQGADVVAIDVMPVAIDMTRARLQVFGLREVALHVMNGAEIADGLSGQQFDLIIFYAALEHMTHDERIVALRAAWSLLRPSGFLGVAEAPNRLWYFDDHTTDLPFFHWLQDEIAFEYWKRSPNFDGAFETMSDEAMLDLRRRGRGVSFHEFELALGPLDELDIQVDLHSFLTGQNALRWLHYGVSTKRRYAEILRKLRPDIPPGFFMPYLDIIIRKSAEQPQRQSTSDT